MERRDTEWIFNRKYIRLIGELLKKEMVPERIIHHIFKELLLGSDNKKKASAETPKDMQQKFGRSYLL